MTDLTRFDFHALRFMNSETVKEMTAEEVGQFVLLLCDSWLLGKAATLPDNAAYLARAARCSQVSELVMSKFPLVETEYGPRRRNDRLYGEWLITAERSASASERGKLGVEARRSGSLSSSISSSSTSRLSIAKNNFEPKPDQVSPDQTSSFKTIRTRWYAYFKKNLSNSKRNHEQYASACSAHGEDRVLDYLDRWATNNQWVSSHPKGENRLYVFLADLPSMIDGDQLRKSKQSHEDLTEDQISILEAEDDVRNARANEDFRKLQEADAALAKLSEGVPF